MPYNIGLSCRFEGKSILNSREAEEGQTGDGAVDMAIRLLDDGRRNTVQQYCTELLLQLLQLLTPLYSTNFSA